VGSEDASSTLNAERRIDFDSTVTLPGASPELRIDPSGGVTAFDVNYTETATEFIVEDLINTGDLGGSASFVIPTSVYDSRGSVNVALTGTPTFEFTRSFGSVTIENQSTKDLRINDIDVLNETGQLAVNVSASIGGLSGFPTLPSQSAWVPTITTVDGAPPVSIRNTHATSDPNIPDILLDGEIDNPRGTTTIETTRGSIISNLAGSTAQIVTNQLTLTAGGAIGASANPIRIDSSQLTATAESGIYIEELVGDLNLVEATSTSGVVSLTAAGSIVDVADDGSEADVEAPTIELTSQTGEIGNSANDLEVDAVETIAAGTEALLSASAKGDIIITDVEAELKIGRVISREGDVVLTLPDTSNTLATDATGTTPGTGEHLGLDDGAVIQAVTGAITLLVGDNVTVAELAVINAAALLIIRADRNGGVDGAGGTVDLRGAVTGSSVTITTEDDDDTVSLRGITATTTIETFGGSDAIHVGSNATPSSNTGGLLNTVDAQLTVSGGGGTGDTLELDDSGNSSNASGTLANNGVTLLDEVTGFGMASGVQYEGIEDLQVFLGAGNDTVTIRSSQDPVATTLSTGAGDDTINVGNAGLTLDDIAGLLTLNGEAGTGDTLSLIDTGDDEANLGVLTNTRITGLGMGANDADPPNDARGILYWNLESINVSLGTGRDIFTVHSIGDDTTISAGGDADRLIVDADLSTIQAVLLLQGGGNTDDTLDIIARAPATLTLDTVNSIRGRIYGIPGEIQFEQLDSTRPDALEIQLADTGNDYFTILGTVVPVMLNTGDGNNDVTIATISDDTDITLGSGTDIVTIFDSLGKLSVDATLGGIDTLIVDRTADVLTSSGSITDGTGGPDEGVLSGLTTEDITFVEFEVVEVNLGSGNDDFNIDNSLADTNIRLDGGDGDEDITVRSIGGLSGDDAETNIFGRGGEDTVTVFIGGFPTPNQFIKLTVDVEELVVDNTANTSQPVPWILRQTILQADLGTPTILTDDVEVINTDGAEFTRILGGGSPTDSLHVVSETNGQVTGIIDGNSVELRSGAVVLQGADFDEFRNYDFVIGFDSLGASQNTYSAEEGFELAAFKYTLGDTSVAEAAIAGVRSGDDLVSGVAFNLEVDGQTVPVTVSAGTFATAEHLRVHIQTAVDQALLDAGAGLAGDVVVSLDAYDAIIFEPFGPPTSFVSDDYFSLAAKAVDQGAPGTGDVFVLTSNTGSAFALYSIDLALTSGPNQQVIFEGTTLRGGTVTTASNPGYWTVTADQGFQRFDFGPEFDALVSVSWTPGAVLVDNIVVREVLSNVAPAPTPSALDTATLSGVIDIDISAHTINGEGDGDFIDGVQVSTSVSSGVLKFRFAGNLNIEDGASLSFTDPWSHNHGISLSANGDIIIGEVNFDFSARDRLSGPGGGDGGIGGSSAGTAGTKGTAGGGGGNGGGENRDGQDGGGAGTSLFPDGVLDGRDGGDGEDANGGGGDGGSLSGGAAGGRRRRWWRWFRRPRSAGNSREFRFFRDQRRRRFRRSGWFRRCERRSCPCRCSHPRHRSHCGRLPNTVERHYG
jgi:hypothetical protein